MDILAPLLIGIVSGIHCIGMCGPLALALPGSQFSTNQFWMSRFIYNLGRTFTYSILGASIGFVSSLFVFSGYQQILSIIGGIGMLFFISISSHTLSRIFIIKHLQSIIQNNFKYLFKRKIDLFTFLFIGILNGFLPCGVIYIALAGAFATGTIINGALFMFWFGIGTFPAMLAVSAATKTKVFKNVYSRLKYVSVIIALLLIFRGLNLDIPYISPYFDTTTQKVKCH